MNNSASSVSTPLHLLGAQYFKMNSPAPSRFIVRRQRIWVLELIISGQLEVRKADDDWITLQKHNGILYPPETRYQEKVLSKGAICQSIGLFYELGDVPHSSPWDRLFLPCLIVSDEERLLTPLAEECIQHVGLSVSDDMRATAAFLRIMAQLLGAENRENMLIVASDYPGGDIVARAHQYMRKRLGETLLLAEIADEVGMSVSGFAHYYKRQTGNSPMTMLRRMRVETAKSFLMRGQFTLGQIANETGFADAFHLSRTFKEVTGVSPRQFRRGGI